MAAELINNASDVHELPKMLEAVKDVLGTYPEQTLANAGYRSEAVFKALNERTELVGSRASWASVSSACVDCTGCKPNGSSCAWR